MVTTISITADRVSIRTLQSDWKRPTLMNGAMWAVKCQPLQTTLANVSQPSAQERKSSPVVTLIEATSPIRRPKSPAIAAPTSGASTRTVTMSCGVIAP